MFFSVTFLSNTYISPFTRVFPFERVEKSSFENPALLIQKENSQDIKSGDLVDILLLNNIK